MRERVGESADVCGGGLLSEWLHQRHAVQPWLLLPCRVQEHAVLPVGVLMRSVRSVKPYVLRRWELLSIRSVECCELCAGQLLSKGLLKPELVQCRLLLPQRVGAAAVRCGL